METEPVVVLDEDVIARFRPVYVSFAEYLTWVELATEALRQDDLYIEQSEKSDGDQRGDCGPARAG